MAARDEVRKPSKQFYTALNTDTSPLHTHMLRGVMGRDRHAACLVIAGALLLSAVGTASAQSGSRTQVWINPGIYSFHFDRDKNLRDNNVGLGVEALFSDDHGAMAGTFINSNRTRSHYAAYAWRPLHWEVAGVRVSAGIAAGAFDGYPNYRNGAWFAAAMPLLAIEGRYLGANLSIVPTYANRLDGAIAVQLKFRIW